MIDFLRSRSFWLLPSILFLIIIVFSALRISGTSIAEYDEYFYPQNYTDKNLLFGQARAIRSDEYVVETPLAAAQEESGYQVKNGLIGLGQVSAAVSNTPTKHWSTIFKPQNWSFFVLPFENAFAFKWWFRGFLLITGAYLFLYKFTKGNLLLSVSGSLLMFFTPFVHWLYSTTAVESFAYFFFALFAFMKIIDYQNWKTLITFIPILAYSSIAFLFLLYPPFLIPIAWLGVSFCIGYILNERKRVFGKRLKYYIASFVVTFLLIGIVLALYYFSFKDIIEVIRNTSYPGNRQSFGGSLTFLWLFSGFFNIIYQYSKQVPPVFGNATDGSNGLLTVFFALPVVVFILIKKFIKKEEINFIGLSLSLFVFLLLIWQITGLPKIISKLTLLTQSSAERALSGMILANFIFTFFWLTKVKIEKTLDFKIVAFLLALFAGLIHFYLGFYLKGSFPLFNDSALIIYVISLSSFLITFSLLLQKTKIFLVLILGYSVLSTIIVNPLYVGLNPLLKSELPQDLRKVEQSNTEKNVGLYMMDTL